MWGGCPHPPEGVRRVRWRIKSNREDAKGAKRDEGRFLIFVAIVVSIIVGHVTTIGTKIETKMRERQ